jgi:hypothetical protein
MDELPTRAFPGYTVTAQGSAIGLLYGFWRASSGVGAWRSCEMRLFSSIWS